jgi:hypothetical protein
MSAAIYWIRSKEHTDITCQGYVGVAKNASKRWWGHKWALKAGRHDNPLLSNAVNKHGWDNLVKEIVLIADEQYCYDIENKLRSESKIGWNLAVGGCKPPVSKSRGPDYVSPLKGVSRPTPWLVGREKPMPEDFFSKGGKAGKGRKQTPEQIAKRVASRRATLAAQGRTV